MTQNEKDLVLKDLCARLPHGVNMAAGYGKGVLTSIRINDSDERLGINIDPTLIRMFSVNDVKPYLFPLSSMTTEQKNEFNTQSLKLQLQVIDDEIMYEKATEFEVDFYNKHHLDWRGLIPMGLAIDATGKNIY